MFELDRKVKEYMDEYGMSEEGASRLASRDLQLIEIVKEIREGFVNSLKVLNKKIAVEKMLTRWHK